LAKPVPADRIASRGESDGRAACIESREPVDLSSDPPKLSLGTVRGNGQAEPDGPSRMLAPRMFAWIASLVLLTQDPAPPATEGGFRTLPLDAALIAARDERRVVLLAFFAPGSPEAQRMEESVWSDLVMQRWLEARTVALRIDVLRESELAQRFGVTTTPCTMLAVPSGDEVERVTGVFDARKFMQSEQFELRSAEVIAAARKVTRERPADLTAVVDLGRAYYGIRRAQRASECFLEAWDRGLSDRSFDEMRRSLLPRHLQSCATKLPEFRKQVVARRDATRERLLKLGESDDLVALALDLGALNVSLAAGGKQTETWRALRDREGTPKSVVEALFDADVEHFLFNEHSFEELVSGRGDVLAYVDGLYAALAEEERAAAARAASKPVDPSGTPAPDETLVKRNATLSIATMYAEALGGSTHAAQSIEVARIVTAFDRRVEAWTSMVAAIARAGRLDEARAIAAEAREALAGTPESLARFEKSAAKLLGSKL
jgi:hypothetical protein